MTTLSEKSRENLRILKNLGENDILSSSSLRKFLFKKNLLKSIILGNLKMVYTLHFISVYLI